jgi:hypothetical protein
MLREKYAHRAVPTVDSTRTALELNPEAEGEKPVTTAGAFTLRIQDLSVFEKCSPFV